nr:preprotein translocase subunit YajC [uncultured Sellimonas sp.]
MEYTVLAQQSSSIFANPIFLLLFYVVILGGLWFILMRPQKKEQKRIQAMIADMEVGDTVLTTSGFYGVVIDITEEDVIVEFGNNKNCRIPMQKAAIMQVEKPGADAK